ncbi:MAG: PAS domain S-box protein, partial [Vulcanimicrobiaceae bacterium]
MTRISQATRRRDWLGTALTLLAAVALLFVLTRIASISSQAGSDQTRLARERAAIAVARSMTPGLLALLDYRSATALSEPTIAAIQKPILSSAVTRIGHLLATGDAQQMGLATKWSAVETPWAKAQTDSGAKRVSDLTDMVGAWIDIYSKMQDASGLTYDTSLFAQDLGDATLNSQPPNLAATERSRMEALLAIRKGTMTLSQRLDFATRLDAIQGLADLSPDNIVPALKKYKLQNAAIGPLIDRTIVLVGAYSRQAKLFSTTVNFGVVLKQKPTLARAKLDASAARMRRITLNTFDALTTILDAQLVQRSRLRDERDSLTVGAIIAGVLLVVGLMLLMAQFSERRSRRALVEAKRESERLSEQIARQRAEEALRLSEAQFRAIFERALIGIAILDADGKIVDANAVFRSFFGESSEALVGNREVEFRELMLGERDGYEAEIHVLTPTGSEAWLATSLSLVRDDENRPRFAVCTFRDLSALRANERRMLHDKTHDALTGLANRPEFEEVLR